jgi:thioredoxin
MTQPNAAGASPPWFLIIGLFAGILFVGYIVWDSAKPSHAPATSENVVELTTENWQKEVVESKIPVFVDFTAKWCGPCKQFAPTVNRLADRYKGKVKVAKFDVGDQGMNKGGDITAKFGINGIPHIMIFMGGPEPVHRSGITANMVDNEMRFSGMLDKLLAAQ